MLGDERVLTHRDFVLGFRYATETAEQTCDARLIGGEGEEDFLAVLLTVAGA